MFLPAALVSTNSRVFSPVRLYTATEKPLSSILSTRFWPMTARPISPNCCAIDGLLPALILAKLVLSSKQRGQDASWPADSHKTSGGWYLATPLLGWTEHSSGHVAIPPAEGGGVGALIMQAGVSSVQEAS